MHPLIKTEMPYSKGTLISTDRDMDTRTVREMMLRYMAALSTIFEGTRLIADDRGDEIVVLDQVLFVANTAAVVVFRVQLIETLDADGLEQAVRYTRYQFVFLQIDPEQSKWNWKHLVTIDSRGGEGIPPLGCTIEDSQFVYLWNLDDNNELKLELTVLIAWRQNHSNEDVEHHSRISPIGCVPIQIKRVSIAEADEESLFPVFDAELMI